MDQGAQGIVYKGAIHNEPVILKKALTRVGTVAIEQEACYLAKIQQRITRDSPFPKLYGITKKQEMVAEFIDGITGADFVDEFDKRPNELKNSLKVIVRNLVIAMKQMAQAGFVHNDLSLLNFMVKKDYKVSLIDLGMTTRISQTARRDFQLNRSSPEVLVGLPLSPASDIFSLGCILFLFAVDNSLFINTNQMKTKWKEFEIKAQQLKASGTKPTSLANDGEFWDLVSKMIRYSPKERITHSQILFHPFLKTNGPPIPLNSLVTPASRGRTKTCQMKPNQWFCDFVGKSHAQRLKAISFPAI